MENIVKKIKETTNVNNEFVDKCSKYLGKDDMISYSEVKDLIGYKQKRTIEEMLENEKYDFILNVDYKIVKEKKEGICKPVNEIYMTMDTIKCICMTAPTKQSQEFRRYYLQMEKVFRQFATTEMLNKVTNPIPKFNDYVNDLPKYKNKEVVYLIELPETNEYKYGMTCDVEKRLKSHAKTFKYTGVIKIWDCLNKTVSSKVEDNIKSYMIYHKINIKRGTMTELFKTDDITKVIKIIDQYTATFIKEHYDQFKDVKLEKENELIKNKLELAKYVSEMVDKLGLNKDTLKSHLSKENDVEDDGDSQDEKPKKIKQLKESTKQTKPKKDNKTLNDVL